MRSRSAPRPSAINWPSLFDSRPEAGASTLAQLVATLTFQPAEFDAARVPPRQGDAALERAACRANRCCRLLGRPPLLRLRPLTVRRRGRRACSRVIGRLVRGCGLRTSMNGTMASDRSSGRRQRNRGVTASGVHESGDIPKPCKRRALVSRWTTSEEALRASRTANHTQTRITRL